MMSQKKFDALILGALQNEEIRAAICDVINKAFNRTVRMERKTKDDEHPVVTEEALNMVDVLATYLPRAEGAIRGCQAASEQARNRAVEVRDMMGGQMLPAIAAAVRRLPEIEVQDVELIEDKTDG